ncbi:MAG: hypothetical protein KDC27_05080, partial [Acidobacteria bacterium]|nr:hypothetical protein [Acidobacteriota bacterium]
MEVLTFLVLAPLTIALWVKLSRLQTERESDAHRLRELQLEIDALRSAFHRRIAKLEGEDAAAPRVG